MKITINGDINRFYVQTLCLLFFPGAKFSESEEVTEDTVTADVTLDEGSDEYRCRVKIKYGGETFTGNSALKKDAPLTRPSMAKKIAVGRAFIEAGEKMSTSSVPWGILTGVRPSKFALSNLESGMSAEECERSLTDEFMVSPFKAKLATSVALSEKKLIRPQHYNMCSVYISIPFCPTRCSYCSFVSFTSKKLLDLIPEYIEVLKSEIADSFKIIKETGLKVASVYIGGGTPTVLSEAQLAEVLDAVSDVCDVSSLEEFTLEAGRPDTINAEKLRIAKERGVTRISVNPQTLNDDILKSIGRNHTVSDFYRAYDIAKNSGIKNINIDLIAGLPGDSYDSFCRSLNGVIGLSPENITLHTFCVKKAADVRRNDESVYNSRHDTAAQSVDFAGKRLTETGYIPYYMYRQKNTMGNLENTGWSRAGHEGLYNIFMMEEIHTVAAIGAGAVTKLVRRAPDGKVTMERLFENKYPFEYISEKQNINYSKDEYAKAFREFYSKC